MLSELTFLGTLATGGHALSLIGRSRVNMVDAYTLGNGVSARAHRARQVEAK